MTTFIQLHLLTAYPPANLNRDDTGRPKTALFGGAPRLRVSSQALKRAWRTSPVFQSALSGHLGERTQRFGSEIRQHLTAKGVDEKRAEAVAKEIARIFGKLEEDKGRDPTSIKQLAFISPEERKAAFDAAEKIAAGKEIDLKSESLLRTTDSAVDIAMFGRMLADDPAFNREAAVQVAHAITTHRATVEDDYYTAVDDLKTAAEDAGAGFIGEAGFGAGLFYLYVCVDRDLLVQNLAGDDALAKAGIAALVEAAGTVSPGGKRASFASHAQASYILVERGSSAPRTLGAAFLKPIDGIDLLGESVKGLRKIRANFTKAYGKDAEAEAEMNVPDGTGTLADVIACATA